MLMYRRDTHVVKKINVVMTEHVISWVKNAVAATDAVDLVRAVVLTVPVSHLVYVVGLLTVKGVKNAAMILSVKKMVCVVMTQNVG